MNQLDGIAIVDVCGHDVPLPAYWKILELWDEGVSEEKIVKQVCRFTGPDKIKSVKEVVQHVLDNQRRMKNVPSQPNALKRHSVMVTKTKRISAYRVTRLQARADLEDAKVQLESAKETERQLLNQTMVLSKETVKVSQHWQSIDRLSRLKEEMKEVLQKHRLAEAEVQYWKDMVKIHRASLA